MGKFLKKRENTETSRDNKFKSLLSNLQTTVVNITSNVEQPPGEKRIKAEKRF